MLEGGISHSFRRWGSLCNLIGLSSSGPVKNALICCKTSCSSSSLEGRKEREWLLCITVGVRHSTLERQEGSVKKLGLQRCPSSSFLTTLLPKHARKTGKRLERLILERRNLSPCSKKLSYVSQYTKSLHCKIVIFPFITDFEILCAHTSVQQEQVSKCGTCRFHCKGLSSKNKLSKSF